MKTVIITVKGKGPVYWMENLMEPENYENVPPDEDFWELEDEGYLDGDLYELPLILEDVLVLQSSDPENQYGIWMMKVQLTLQRRRVSMFLPTTTSLEFVV